MDAKDVKKRGGVPGSNSSLFRLIPSAGAARFFSHFWVPPHPSFRSTWHNIIASKHNEKETIFLGPCWTTWSFAHFTCPKIYFWKKKRILPPFWEDSLVLSFVHRLTTGWLVCIEKSSWNGARACHRSSFPLGGGFLVEYQFSVHCKLIEKLFCSFFFSFSFYLSAKSSRSPCRIGFKSQIDRRKKKK